MESALFKRSSLRMARGGCGKWTAISKKGSVVGQAGACLGGGRKDGLEGWWTSPEIMTSHSDLYPSRSEIQKSRTKI